MSQAPDYNTPYMKMFILLGIAVLAVVVALILVPKDIPVEAPKDNGFWCGTKALTKVKVGGEAYERGKVLFQRKCAACHNPVFKYQDPAYPSLAGVVEKRDSVWIRAMIRNTSGLLESGDSLALAQFEEYGVAMTSFSDLTDEEVEDLITFLRLGGN